MSELIQAADSIRKIARQLEGFKVAADALERLGSIEQAEGEAKAAAAKAAAERDAAKAEVARMNETLGVMKDEAVKIEASAQQARAAILVEAEESAKAKIAQANETAAGLVREAQERAAAIEAGAKARAEDITSEHRAALAAVADAVAERDAAMRDLAEVQQKIAQAKAQIAKMLGE